MSEPRQARLYRVEGRVQGVYFRASAQREATRLGITGWVRNLDDGAVEAYACGTSEQLAGFEDWLWQGPAGAQVYNVSIDAAPVEIFAIFSVRR
jgi:acylphosphatase